MKKFYGYTSEQTQAWVEKARLNPPHISTNPEEKKPEKQKSTDEFFIQRAIKLASHNPMQALKKEAVDGGFFGALLYKDGKILGEGWNTVLKEGDPTRHAEMNAIRQATHENGYGLSDLEGATLYTSGAPCPMCYAAIMWANISKIVYSSNYEDAMKYGGFRDEPINTSLKLPLNQREIPSIQMESELSRTWWQLYANEVYKDGEGQIY